VTRSLPSAQQRAVAGRAAGFAPRETAAEFGVPVKTVHLALCRARTTLKAVALAGLGLVLWRRRRMPSVSSPMASVAVLALTRALLLLIHLDRPSGPNLHQRAADTTVAAIRSVAGAQPPSLPPALRSDLTDGGPRASMATSPHRPAAVGAAVPQREATLGTPNLVSTGVEISRAHPNRSFVDSVQACLAPGGLSLDPHHAGCTSGS
jgi:hypothetical protein